MKKRGQVTIFIIIGIVLLLLIALVSYYLAYGDLVFNVGKFLPQDIKAIKEMRDECAEKSALESLYVLGLRGGNYEVGENGISFFG